MKILNCIICIVSLFLGNLIYQAMVHDAINWAVIAERYWFQAVAVFAYAVFFSNSKNDK